MYLISLQQLLRQHQHPAAATHRQLQQRQRQRQPQGSEGVSSRNQIELKAPASRQVHQRVSSRKRSLSRIWCGWRAAPRKSALLLVQLSNG
jgi:hypothetical protein